MSATTRWIIVTPRDGFATHEEALACVSLCSYLKDAAIVPVTFTPGEGLRPVVEAKAGEPGA